MDKIFDEETKATLLKALEGAKAYNQKLQENREKRLWKKINLPCSLMDAINGLTKNEMDEIRKNYEFKNLSSLKKAELAAELAKLVPLKFNRFIYALDQSRYDFIKAVIDKAGAIFDIDISSSQAEALRNHSVIFPGIHDGQRVLFMPEEMISIFSQIDGSELEDVVRRNTEWIRLTYGLLYFHGVMDALVLRRKISELTDQEIDILEYMDVLSFAFEFYENGSMTHYGFQDDRVFDARKVLEEHRKRANIDYYPFTKKQLLKAGDPDYVDITPAMDSFIDFLLDHYELSDEDTKEIAMQITNKINLDAKPSFIIQYLQSLLEFPSFEFVQLITARIMDLHNNTRQWALKGYTPNELRREGKRHLTPLPDKPKRASVSTRTKVGRNEPCPCGSGKKYKKCCGR